jgi:hypothetical protein
MEDGIREVTLCCEGCGRLYFDISIDEEFYDQLESEFGKNGAYKRIFQHLAERYS